MDVGPYDGEDLEFMIPMDVGSYDCIFHEQNIIDCSI